MKVRRKHTIAAALLAIALTACGLTRESDDRCMGKIIQRTAQSARKNGFQYQGWGVASEVRPPYWLKKLTIRLGYSQTVNQAQARGLLIWVARTMKDEVDRESCSDLLFQELPVDPTKIGVVIAFGDGSEDKSVLPLIQVASLIGGELRYYAYLTEESETWDYEYSETLEEALKKLGESRF